MSLEKLRELDEKSELALRPFFGSERRLLDEIWQIRESRRDPLLEGKDLFVDRLRMLSEKLPSSLLEIFPILKNEIPPRIGDRDRKASASSLEDKRQDGRKIAYRSLTESAAEVDVTTVDMILIRTIAGKYLREGAELIVSPKAVAANEILASDKTSLDKPPPIELDPLLCPDDRFHTVPAKRHHYGFIERYAGRYHPVEKKTTDMRLEIDLHWR